MYFFYSVQKKKRRRKFLVDLSPTQATTAITDTTNEDVGERETGFFLRFFLALLKFSHSYRASMRRPNGTEKSTLVTRVERRERERETSRFHHPVFYP